MAWGIAILVLMGMIIGGGLLITHNASWSLDDATIIQSTVGSGEMMDVYDEPGFQPRAGRLFPLAYMHTNIALLFEHGYCEALPFFRINAVLWVIFIVLIFAVSYMVSAYASDKEYIRILLAIVSVLIVGQRCLYEYANIWLTSSAGEALVICITLFFICFCRTRKWLYGVVLLGLMIYYVFCGELNSIIPLMMGVLMLIFSKEKWLGWGSLCVVALYICTYSIAILPNISDVYDSSHGTSMSMIQNAINILQLQKLLMVAFGLLIWRMYKVFIMKDEYRLDTDTLLAAGCAYAVGCFIMRLNWGLYYDVVIIYTMPSMIRELNFFSKRATIISSIIIMLFGFYFVIKYPQLIKAIYHNKEANAVDMQKIDTHIKNASNIAWYVDEAEAANTDNFYLRCHVIRDIRHVKQDKEFEFKDYTDVREDDILICPLTQDPTKLNCELQLVESLDKVKIYQVEP